MFLPLLIGVATVVAGALLAFAPLTSERWTGPVRSFAIVACATVVFVHLLPESYQRAGPPSLLVFAAGILIPLFIERLLGHRHVHAASDTTHGIGFELGYVGLLLHAASDGLAFWAFGRSGHLDWAVLLALAAHAVPLTALVVLHERTSVGASRAIGRAAGLALAVALGVMLAESTPAAWLADVEPWIGAGVAALLVHVIIHGFGAPPKGLRFSKAEWIAGLGGLILPLIGTLSSC